MLLRISSSLFRLSRQVTTKAEIIDTDAVCSKIESEIHDATKRLFAVVYINGRQWKVTQGDLIALEGELPLTAGDVINLEKVLLVGGQNFSVFGRPFLDPSAVTVRATVVEKSPKSPEVFYFHNNHQQTKQLHWLTRELTVLRINEVTARNKCLGFSE